MKLNNLFKILSKLSLVLFYVSSIMGLFVIIVETLIVFTPGSKVTKVFWEFEPIFTYVNLTFSKQPSIYSEKSFMLLSLLSIVSSFLFTIMFLWFIHKLLKNIYKDSLFMFENVTILMKLGLTTLIIGVVSSFSDGMLLSKALTQLQIANAQISYSNIAYVDVLISGIVMIIFALALKKAVQAMEENKHTI